jgi:hypothetical protein
MVHWWVLVHSGPSFAGVLLNLTLCMTKLRVLVLCFSYFTDNSISLSFSKKKALQEPIFHTKQNMTKNPQFCGRLFDWFLDFF